MSRLTAVATILAAMVTASAASAADKVVLQLHGPAQFEFAGYYAALWQGFYRDAGLEVEIKPGASHGQDPVDPVREVTEGRAQFGTGTAELVVRIAQGLPLLLLAPIFQQSGAAVYYRTDADFPSPATLVKAKLGRLPASDILDIELLTALKAEGVDRGKLKSVPLNPDQIAGALVDRSVDAAIGSPWELPWRAYEKGIALKSFNPADYRVEFYGDTLFTTQRLARAEPQTVRGFRAASLKGWEYAFQHQDEIEQRLLAELPVPPGIADATGFTHYQAELARRLARYPDVALGHANPERWDRIEASMVAVGAMVRTADPDDFVFDPDAEARSQTDRRSLTILGAALAGGLGLLLLLWLSRRRRAAVAGAVAGDRPEAATAPAPAAEPTATTPTAPAQPEPVQADLNALLFRLDRAMRQRVPRRVVFRLSLLPELWRCRAEAPIVRKLALDLVAGACLDLRGNGELVVGTRNAAFDSAALAATPDARIGEYARLTVKDSGPGLSEAALGRIFDRTATSRPSAAAAAEAMGELGGFVRVESAEGVGTAVHLYFPRVAEPVAGALKEGKPAEAAA